LNSLTANRQTFKTIIAKAKENNMSAFFKKDVPQDIDYEGFYDGQNKTVADNSEFEFSVTDGFVGIEEGKSQQVCVINIVITTKGEFYGQKYRYNAKIFDMDANKRDLAMKNLGVLDAQAGFPMTNGELDLTTENIQDYWVGSVEARVKFGLMISTEDMQGNKHLDEHGNETTKEINFVRGFAYDREKMRKAGQQQATQQADQQATQQTEQQQASGPAYADQSSAQETPDNDDIDF
jgi:hypothetical protein